MEIKLKIDKKLNENYCEIFIREMTPEISEMITSIQNFDYKIIVNKDGSKYSINLDKIITLYSENKKILLKTDNNQIHSMYETIKHLSQKLPYHFLRISNSEIINTNKISHFEFTFGGKIKIYFNNGDYTYSSRSYLIEIKRYFGL
ncbi:LytTR family DNA-binding domain-containing protein (plasmid) [Lactococcus garvieae]|uniref:LytTR family DNA-binding domain-containing protein n=1 Tax=Lactococcus garvieae TaxID=1363 RepID=UPI0030D15E69